MRSFNERIEKLTTESLAATLTRLGISAGGGGSSIVEVLGTQTTPPGSPTTGDAYLVKCGATGAWAGQAGKLAEWSGSTWMFTVPDGNLIVVDQQSGILYTRNAALGFGATVDYVKFYQDTYGFWQGSILGQLSAPPGSPSDGDRYLVIPTATGVFTGHEDDIATYYCGNWHFVGMAEGQLIYDTGANTLLQYDSTLNWVSYNGVPNATFDINSPTNKEVIIHDGTNFTNRELLLSDVSDVPTPVALNTVLTVSNLGPAGFTWAVPSGSGATQLNDLSDVDLSTDPFNIPLKKVFLQYIGTKVQPSTITTRELEDVTTSVATAGQALVSNGSQYEPQSVLLTSESINVRRGTVVGSSGAIQVGSGFGITKIGTGVYRVDLTPGFSSVAVAVVSLASGTGLSNDRTIRVDQATSINFVVYIRTTAGNPVDDNFSFIAVGNS